MFVIKAKIYGVLYKQPSSIAFDETSSYWSAPKTPNFSAFHWSPRGSLVFYWSAFRSHEVVHLPKVPKQAYLPNRTKVDLITRYCSYARPAQPGPIRTRLCWPCIAVIVGYHLSNFLLINIFIYKNKCFKMIVRDATRPFRNYILFHQNLLL